MVLTRTMSPRAVTSLNYIHLGSSDSAWVILLTSLLLWVQVLSMLIIVVWTLGKLLMNTTTTITIPQRRIVRVM